MQAAPILRDGARDRAGEEARAGGDGCHGEKLLARLLDEEPRAGRSLGHRHPCQGNAVSDYSKRYALVSNGSRLPYSDARMRRFGALLTLWSAITCAAAASAAA